MSTTQSKKNKVCKERDRDLITIIKSAGDVDYCTFTDYTKDQQKALHTLYFKYMNLIHRKWGKLSRSLDNSPFVTSEKDDYYSESYFTFLQCVKAIKLSKILNDKWLFLGYFMHYLDAQNNKFFRKIMKSYKNSVSENIFKDMEDQTAETISLLDLHQTSQLVRSAEDDYILNHNKRAFYDVEQECLETVWDETKRELWNLRKNNTNIKSITEILNISSHKIKKHLSEMKADFAERLQKVYIS